MAKKDEAQMEAFPADDVSLDAADARTDTPASASAPASEVVDWDAYPARPYSEAKRVRPQEG